ncbi:hypothetical protein [[Eubacterium] cellulosolvens]
MQYCPECEERLFPDDEICPNYGLRLFDRRSRRDLARRHPREPRTQPRRLPPLHHRSRHRPREEEYPPAPPPPRPTLEDYKKKIKKAPFNYGTWLGVIAIVLILLTVFLP